MNTESEVVIDSLPVRKDSIEELVGHRARALKLFKEAVILMAQAEQAARRAAPMEAHAGCVSNVLDRFHYTIANLPVDGEKDDDGVTRIDRLEEILEAARRRIDSFAWTSLQRLSGLRNLMDAQATKKFAKQLEENPPEFCVDNITATYMSLAADASNIFERGLVNVFRDLDSGYVTNSAFRIGKRVILSHVLGWYGWANYGRHGRETVADLDRVFHVLDGKKPPEGSNAADVLAQARKDKLKTCDTPYFSARLFHVNGNVHLTFKRDDLVKRANDIIASHLGATLPDDRKRQW